MVLLFIFIQISNSKRILELLTTITLNVENNLVSQTHIKENNSYSNFNGKNLMNFFDEHPNISLNEGLGSKQQFFKKSNRIDITNENNIINNSFSNYQKIERKCECKMNFTSSQEVNLN